jgi:hypothetical protein
MRYTTRDRGETWWYLSLSVFCYVRTSRGCVWITIMTNLLARDRHHRRHSRLLNHQNTLTAGILPRPERHFTRVRSNILTYIHIFAWFYTQTHPLPPPQLKQTLYRQNGGEPSSSSSGDGGAVKLNFSLSLMSRLHDAHCRSPPPKTSPPPKQQHCWRRPDTTRPLRFSRRKTHRSRLKRAHSYVPVTPLRPFTSMRSSKLHET